MTSKHANCSTTQKTGIVENVYAGCWFSFFKATGEERALKISKFRGDSHNQRDIQRELDAFLSLRQDNIVAFHGIEEEVSGLCAL